jgi:hypothetical protein
MNNILTYVYQGMNTFASPFTWSPVVMGTPMKRASAHGALVAVSDVRPLSRVSYEKGLPNEYPALGAPPGDLKKVGDMRVGE